MRVHLCLKSRKLCGFLIELRGIILVDQRTDMRGHFVKTVAQRLDFPGSADIYGRKVPGARLLLFG
jgi:hypothetical protein